MKQTDCKKLKTSESTNKILKGIEFLKRRPSLRSEVRGFRGDAGSEYFGFQGKWWPVVGPLQREELVKWKNGGDTRIKRYKTIH